jgi:hypothetical protein
LALPAEKTNQNNEEPYFETNDSDLEELTKIIQTFSLVCQNDEIDTYCCLEKFLDLPQMEYGSIDIFCNRQMVMLSRLLQVKESAIFNHFNEVRMKGYGRIRNKRHIHTNRFNLESKKYLLLGFKLIFQTFSIRKHWHAFMKRC